jgi:hypothetical protein
MIDIDALNRRAIERLTEIASPSPMATVRMSVEYPVIHIIDHGLLGNQGGIMPPSVHLAIHLAKSDIEPTSASISLVNGVEVSPEEMRRLLMLMGEIGAIGEVATNDPILAEIGIIIHNAHISNRNEFLRNEQERNNILRSIREKAAKEREERRIAATSAAAAQRALRRSERSESKFAAEREKFVLRLARANAAVQDAEARLRDLHEQSKQPKQ